jgi:hypothetical protein
VLELLPAKIDEVLLKKISVLGAVVYKDRHKPIC